MPKTDISITLRTFHKYAKQRGMKALKEVAQEGRDELVFGIKTQNFPSFHMTPLAPSTVARKASLGLDPRVMIATGHYVDSIKVFKEDKHTYRVGFDPEAKAVDSQGIETEVSLNTVARAQEFGTERIPARPHWKAAFLRLKNRHRK